jgi:hypothetical protein
VAPSSFPCSNHRRQRSKKENPNPRSCRLDPRYGSKPPQMDEN